MATGPDPRWGFPPLEKENGVDLSLTGTLMAESQPLRVRRGWERSLPPRPRSSLGPRVQPITAIVHRGPINPAQNSYIYILWNPSSSFSPSICLQAPHFLPHAAARRSHFFPDVARVQEPWLWELLCRLTTPSPSPLLPWLWELCRRPLPSSPSPVCFWLWLWLWELVESFPRDGVWN